jgi:hypothetical protein
MNDTKISTLTALYPQVETEKWASTYGLEVRSLICAGCEREVNTTVPFAIGNWRGLLTPEHGCGEKHRVSIAVEWKNKKEWQKLINEKESKKVIRANFRKPRKIVEVDFSPHDD